MIKVAIVGGTGYTGVELLRILALHPEVQITTITSRAEAGSPVANLFPNLRGYLDICFSEPNTDELAKADLVFFATPNGTAMQETPRLLAEGVKVIDLAADFRLKDAAVWQQWYGMPHACPELLEEAVYGLPEINREAIRSARLIANPGCYPTAVTLGFLPLVEAGWIDLATLIADAKSGVSGAGRGASVGTLLCEASESIKAYGVGGHRHLPEIRQNLSIASGAPVGLTFVPHLTPMIRGIEATLYARISKNCEIAEIQRLYEERYQQEYFVDVLPEGGMPDTRSVKGSNHCRIAVHRPQGGDTLVILSVIDNLVKGAAGQAVQNMNLMMGFPETIGLQTVPLIP